MSVPARSSVDLSGYPELVVIYLGMRVTSWRGLKTVFETGRGIVRAVAEKPAGLLAHEFLLFGPLHVGMRQYWRDLESLEAFTRAMPHKGWWAGFMRDDGGTGFWHEAYRMNGGMEAIYLGMPGPLGFGRFAAPLTPEGGFLTSRQRLET